MNEFLFVSYIGNISVPPISDENCWSLEIRNSGIWLYLSTCSQRTLMGQCRVEYRGGILAVCLLVCLSIHAFIHPLPGEQTSWWEVKQPAWKRNQSYSPRTQHAFMTSGSLLIRGQSLFLRGFGRRLRNPGDCHTGQNQLALGKCQLPQTRHKPGVYASL